MSRKGSPCCDGYLPYSAEMQASWCAFVSYKLVLPHYAVK